MSQHTEAAVIPELELNKETLQDLGVDAQDAAQVKGGFGEVRMTLGTSGPSVIQPGTAVQTGTSVIQPVNHG
jgi:hypothetical protein